MSQPYIKGISGVTSSGNFRDGFPFNPQTRDFITVDFTEPPNGGSPIDYYQYVLSTSNDLIEADLASLWQDVPLGSRATLTTLPLVIPWGSSDYTSLYYIYLRSHNSNGFSVNSRNGSADPTSINTPQSLLQNGAQLGPRPTGVPSRPLSGMTATISGSNATITFTPGSDNGYAITNYHYSTDGTNYVALSPPDTSSPVTIPELQPVR
jgi:hypothetical protein